MYYARMAVPADLVGRILNERGEPRAELRSSLKTSDYREARSRLVEVLRDWHQQFAQERAGLLVDSASRVSPTAVIRPAPEAEAEARILRGTYDRLLELDWRERQSWPTTDQTLTTVKSMVDRHDIAGDMASEFSRAVLAGAGSSIAQRIAQIHQSLPGPNPEDLVSALANAYIGENAKDISSAANADILEDLKEALARGDSSCVADAAAGALTEAGFFLPPDSHEFKSFAHKFHRTMVQVWQRRLERDAGDFTGKPSDDVLIEAPPIAPPIHAGSPTRVDRTLDQWFELYARENRNGLKEHSLNQARQSVRWLAEFVDHKPASAIAKADVAEWIDALRAFPTRAAQIGEYKGLSFHAIVEASREQGRPALAVKTIRRMVSEVSGFFSWMENRGYIERNPAIGQTPRLDKRRQTARRPFKPMELTQLFQSPMFTGCAGINRRYLPGTHELRDAQFWMPLLALFTGARMGELAQMHVTDVIQCGSTWAISISDEDVETGAPVDGKSLKTRSSKRLVPLHSALVAIGFPEFVRSRLGCVRLFPELERNSRGEFSTYSREFARYLQRIDLKFDSALTFHSFRHTFMDALRRGGVRKHERELLAGHARHDMNDQYGEEVDGTVTERATWIEKMRFDGVDAQALVAHAAK